MRRAALALLPIVSLVAPLATGSAAQEASPEPRRAVLVLIPGLTYDNAIRSSVVRLLASRGGIGLMTTAGATESAAAEHVTLGAGAVAGGPEELDLRLLGDSIDVDVNPYVAASGAARPGALAEALEKARRTIGYVALRSAPGYGVLTAMDAEGRVRRERSADVVVLEIRRRDVDVEAILPEGGSPLDAVLVAAMNLVAPRLDGDVLWMFTSAEPSRVALARGDEMSPLIVVGSPPPDLFGAAIEAGPGNGLTSSTTRLEGVVANVDVAPTILDHLGVEIPPWMTGSPIRIEGEAPSDLHARYLQYQRALRPVGITVLLFALLSLVAGGAVLLFWRRAPGWLAGTLAVAGLAGVALQVALLPGSYLPEFDLPLVFAALVAAAGVMTAAALVVGRGRSPFHPVVVVAGAGLVFVALDAALGWRSLITPLLGGSALDGTRFYGLGNSYAGVLMSGAVLLAALLPLWWGGAVIVVAALFAGLPWIGADLGGGLTLFAVAGLWIGARTRGRFDAAAVAIAVAAFVLGFAIIVGVHRLAEDATHVTRATTGAGGWTAIVETFWRRLTLNLEATVSTPVVWPALIGVPVWLVVAARRAGPFAPSLDRSDAWRDAVVVLATGGILGYVLNDTFGMASIAFLYLSLAMVFPALEARWKTA